MLLVKKLEAVQVHVALHFEGPKRFEWISILYDVMQGNKWIMFHGPLDIMSMPLKWGGLNAKLRVVTIIKPSLAPRNIILPFWGGGG